MKEAAAGNAGVSHSTGAKTFAAFTATDAFKAAWSRDPEFAARLTAAAPGIKTRLGLTTWVRQRYPDHYGDWRNSTADKAYGKEAMGRTWADYLNWSEG